MGIHERLSKLALLALGLSLALHGAAVAGYLANLVLAGHDPFGDLRAVGFLHQGFVIQILELGAILFVALTASEFYGKQLREKLNSVPTESIATAALFSIFFAWAMLPYYVPDEAREQNRSLASSPEEHPKEKHPE